MTNTHKKAENTLTPGINTMSNRHGDRHGDRE